jgi:hypothetical protein
MVVGEHLHRTLDEFDELHRDEALVKDKLGWLEEQRVVLELQGTLRSLPSAPSRSWLS